MNIKGQDHILTLVKDHSDSTFSNVFSLEIAGPTQAKVHVESSWDEGMKGVQIVQVTKPTWPPCPFMVKTFKKSSSQEHIGQ